MATHILDANEPTVNPTGASPNDYQNIQTNPEMFGAGIGRAEQGLGQAGTGAADTALDVMTQRQTETNEVHSAQVNTWLSNGITDRLSQFSKLQGQDALNGLPQFKQDIEDLKQKAIAQAGSPQAQVMIARQSAPLVDQYYKYGTNHADQQFQTWQNKTAADHAQTFGDHASVSATNGDFTASENALVLSDESVRANMKTQGLDPISIESGVAKNHGKNVANIVEQLGTVGIAGSGAPNLDVAQAFFKKHEDEMDGSTRLAVEKWLAPRMLTRQAENLGAGIIGGGLSPDPNYQPGAGGSGPGHGRGSINASFTGPIDQPRVPGGPAPIDIYNRVISQGGSRNEAILLSSAAGSEGVYNPGALHDRDANGNPTGYGLFGHRLDRRDAMFSDAGTDKPNWQQQTDFALKELRSRPESALVNAATTPVELANAEMHFEQPRDYSKNDPQAGENYNGRLGTIKRFSALMTSSDGDDGQPQVKPALDKSAAIQKAIDLTEGNPALRDKTIAVINRRYSQFNASNATEMQAIKLDYPNQLAAAEAGDSNAQIPADRIDALFPGPKAQVMKDQFAIAQKVGTVLSGLQFASPTDVSDAARDIGSGLGPISDRIKAHARYGATGPGTVGADPDDPSNGAYFKLRQGAQVRLQQVINQRNQALLGEHNDPAAYVLAEPSVKAAAMAAQKDPSKIGDFVNATLGVQEHLGVPEDKQHIFTRDQAIDTASKLTAPGADVRQNLQQLQATFGTNYPKVFSDLVQLGKLPSSYQAVGALQDADDAQLLSRALQQAPGSGDDGKKAETWNQRLVTATGNATAPSDLKKSVLSHTELQDYLGTLKRQGLTADKVDNVTNDVMLLAQAKVYWNKMSTDTAAASAVEAFTKQYTILPGGDARVPTAVADAVNRDRDTMVSNLDKTNITVPPKSFGGVAQPSADDYVHDIREKHSWMNTPRGDGLMLLDGAGHYVKDAQGKPLTIPFANAGRLTAAAPVKTSSLEGP